MGFREVGLVRDFARADVLGRNYHALRALAEYCNRRGFVFVTTQALADDLRMSEATARRAIHELVALGELAPVDEADLPRDLPVPNRPYRPGVYRIRVVVENPPPPAPRPRRARLSTDSSTPAHTGRNMTPPGVASCDPQPARAPDGPDGPPDGTDRSEQDPSESGSTTGFVDNSDPEPDPPA